jgi:phage replication-related protein YjqB (UPF0714/DUF867 family)
LSTVAGLALALTFGSPAARAAETEIDPCEIGGVQGVTVSLMNAVSDPETRREEMHISRSLAEQLGIGTNGFLRFTPGGEINPQLRVVIQSGASPGTIAGRYSTAVFTVAGIFESGADRIRVYKRLNSSDKDSGEFKLFTGAATPSAGANGDLVGVTARVFWTPVATSTVTRRNSADPSAPSTTTITEIFCEPNGANGFSENGIVEANKRFVLLVPHGGDIETRTSDQVTPVLDTLRADWTVHGSLWNTRGVWGLQQTRERWHITATALLGTSFPVLDKLFAEADFAAGRPFQYALALHGYKDTEKGVIVGGQANRQAKCLVVLRIQDRLEAVGRSRTEIGFRIFDPAGAITIPAGSYTPPAENGGLQAENIVNRLSPNPDGEAGWGGIQLEQSKGVRDDQTSGSVGSNAWLRNVVARGAATALGELITEADSIPADACNLLD